jgi:hypothetical protein
MKAKLVKEGLDFERSGDPRKSLGFGKIHLEHFDSVIITALEGGSNYWYQLFTDDYRDQLVPRTEKRAAFSERISESLYTKPDFKLPVYDVENPDDLLGTVTQSSMFKAFQIAEKDYFMVHKHIFEDEDYDATDADIIFQLATMGEVRFG